ncbi:hypothetical protein CG736_01970 [Kitasatospora sp. CB02891]|nr:hypothetical protein CG736_01970 [Kitasatospora sp. CB02891]
MLVATVGTGAAGEPGSSRTDGRIGPHPAKTRRYGIFALVRRASMRDRSVGGTRRSSATT